MEKTEVQKNFLAQTILSTKDIKDWIKEMESVITNITNLTEASKKMLEAFQLNNDMYKDNKIIMAQKKKLEVDYKRSKNELRAKVGVYERRILYLKNLI